MISAKNKHYQIGNKTLLDDISTSMETGKLTVILGPNGAGKSTLIKCLSGEYVTATGDVRIADLELTEWDSQQLATRRAVVTQFNHIDFPFTVAEIVMLGLLPSKLVCKIDQPERIAEEVMRELNVLVLADRKYSTLSGGEQQRVSIARALVQVAMKAANNESCYLLLDEPTASLDLKYQHELLKLLRNYVDRDFSVVMILHDINLALQYADQVILLKNGDIIDAGDVDDVITVENIEQVFSVQGVLHSTDDGSQRFHVMN